MFSGYLNKRNSPISPPPMQKVYSVLYGTLLMDFENEDDAKQSMAPKTIVEVLGISEWDGKGRANNYPNGFLVVTHTGGTYYLSANNSEERDEWIFHIKRSLECVFANQIIQPFKPSKLLQQRPPYAANIICPKSHNRLGINPVICKSCGRGFYSSEYVSESSTLLQIGLEEAEKVCVDCKNAQLVIIWFKTLNYVHAMELHEHTQEVLDDVNKYKSTFKVMRKTSQRLDMAAKLFEENNLSVEEFDELRKVDHAYRREMAHEESSKLKSALEVFGDDMQTIINVLLNPSLTDPGGRSSYYTVIIRLLEIADKTPDLIDFYFPQLVQIHLLESMNKSTESYIKLDLLQQALLTICKKYPSLGCKLAWSLIGSIGDYYEKRIPQISFAACTALLLQLEMVLTGFVSSIADIPGCNVLSKILVGSSHQQQELGYEIGVLFLVRRKLQETYDEEEKKRKRRNSSLNPRILSKIQDEYSEGSNKTANIEDSAIDYEEKIKELNHKENRSNSHSFDADKDIKGYDMKKKINTKSHSTNKPKVPSCLELLNQLGVGQANSRSIFDDHFSDDEEDDAEEEEEEEEDLEFEEEMTFYENTKGLNLDVQFKSTKLDKEFPKINLSPKLSPSKRNLPSQKEKIEALNRHIYFKANNYFMNWKGFSEQLDFIDRLNELVDSLRFVDRPLRTDALKKTVIKWNEDPSNMLGWDPTTVAGEPQYKITQIFVDECRVFRTKARAPSLIICEVLRDDIYSNRLSNTMICPDKIFTEKNFSQNEESSAPFEDNSSKRVVNYIDGRTVKKTVSNDSMILASKADIDSSILVSHSHHSLLPNGSTQEEAEIYDIVSQNIHDVDNFLNTPSNSMKVHSPPQINPKRPERSKSLKDFKATEAIATQAVHNLRRISSQGKLNSAYASWDNIDPNSDTFLAQFKDTLVLDDESSRFIVPIPRRKSGPFVSSNRLSLNTEGTMIHTDASDDLKSEIDKINSTNSGKVKTISSSIAERSSNASDRTIDSSVPDMVSEETQRDLQIQDKAHDSAESNIKEEASEHQNDLMHQSGDDKYPYHPESDENINSQQTLDESQFAYSSNKVFESARRLLDEGKISEQEYEQLLLSDQQYHDESIKEEASIAKSRVELALGETWENKKSRLLSSKSDLLSHKVVGTLDLWPAWDLRSFIVKSNDDLRQEVCCLQIMQICKEIFDHFGLSSILWLKPYRIISTSTNTGIVQVLNDAVSLDALKKTSGFGSLSKYFEKTYGTSSERLNNAKLNFAYSLAAYSLFSYLLLIKDRHNGNILLDSEGHLLHIDFGFILSIAPGGSFSLETAPFKLTEEMVELLGGLDSPLFGEFVTSFTKGFIALQANVENIVGSLQVLALKSSFPCFAGKQANVIIDKLRTRFRTELSVPDAVKHCLDLITNSYGHYGTRQYDSFQWYSNGIMP